MISTQAVSVVNAPVPAEPIPSFLPEFEAVVVYDLLPVAVLEFMEEVNAPVVKELSYVMIDLWNVPVV